MAQPAVSGTGPTYHQVNNRPGSQSPRVTNPRSQLLQPADQASSPAKALQKVTLWPNLANRAPVASTQERACKELGPGSATPPGLLTGVSLPKEKDLCSAHRGHPQSIAFWSSDGRPVRRFLQKATSPKFGSKTNLPRWYTEGKTANWEKWGINVTCSKQIHERQNYRRMRGSVDKWSTW